MYLLDQSSDDFHDDVRTCGFVSIHSLKMEESRPPGPWENSPICSSGTRERMISRIEKYKCGYEKRRAEIERVRVRVERIVIEIG